MGVITLQAPLQPNLGSHLPVIDVALVTPSAGSLHQVGNAVTVAAAVQQSTNPMNEVSFYIDGTLIGTDTTAPYSTEWIAQPGVHIAQARAKDATGVIRVTPVVEFGVPGSLNTAFSTAEKRFYSWGSGAEYRTGLGDTADRTIPEELFGPPEWIWLSAGGSHGLGLKLDGTIWSWGSGAQGALGHGTTGDVASPQRIGAEHDWIQVSAGKTHSMGIRANGSLWTWGEGSGALPVQLGTALNWRWVSASSSFGLGIKQNGTMWGWGLNTGGQLGVGDNVNRGLPAQIGSASDWVWVEAGDFHSVAIKSDGTLWAWGSGNNGRLGIGSSSAKTAPVQVGSDTDWVWASAGWAHTLAIKEDGSLWSWGYGWRGGLGVGDTSSYNVPTRISTDLDWVWVSAGRHQSYAMKADGTLWSWGDGTGGALGHGNALDQLIPKQVTSAALGTIVDASDTGFFVLGSTLGTPLPGQRAPNLTSLIDPGANTAPSVSLLAPLDAAQYYVGDTVTLRASTIDTQDNVRAVEFYVDDQLLTTDVTAPYEAEWLASNGYHTIYAKAIDSGDLSAVTRVRTVYARPRPSPPPAPNLNLASNSGTGGFTVAWDYMVGVTSYRLAQTYPGANIFHQTPDTSKVYSNMPDGQYSFKVQACNAGGCGAYSPESTITVARTNVAHPISPSGGMVAHYTHHTPCFDWSAAISDYYGVLLSETADFSTTYWQKTPLYGTRACWSNGAGWEAKGSNPKSADLPLQTLKTYYWRAVSYDSGQIIESGSAHFQLAHNIANTIPVPVLAPANPADDDENLAFSVDGSYTLNWSVAASGITKYKLLENGVVIDVENVSAWNLTNKPGGEYVYQISACTNDGICGPYSNAIEVRVSHLSVAELGAPENLSTVAFDEENPCFSWTPTVTDHYNLTISLSEDFATQRWQLNNLTDASACWNDGSGDWEAKGTQPQPIPEALVDGTRYYWRVLTYRGAEIARSETRSFVASVPPSAPQNVSVRYISDVPGHFWIEWEHMDYVPGEMRFKVEVPGANPSDPWTVVRDTTAFSEEFIRTTEAVYPFQVKACRADNTNVCSDPVSVSAAVTLSSGARPSIENLSLTPITNGQQTTLQLSWTHPHQASGGIEYEIYQRFGDNWSLLADKTGSASTVQIQPVLAGVYYYRVRACDTGGINCGLLSTTVGHDLQNGNLGEISALETDTTYSDNGQVYLQWEYANDGGDGIYYKVFQTLDSVPNETPIVSTQTPGASLELLESGDYIFQVEVCNAERCGGKSTAQVSVEVDLLAGLYTADLPDPPAAKPAFQSNTASDEIGTTAGSFRVNESGAATYNIPIFSLPGTAGVAPQLSFNYSSQAGNGLLGQGWSLGGLSSVSRCRQTLHQDRNAQPIRWTDEDRFCLDGQRLVLEDLGSGTYGAPDTVYRTEIDSFARVTAKGGTPGHPDYFVVERKDGSTSFYGRSPDSANADAKLVNGNGAVLRWSLKEFTDSAGNPIWFVYETDADGHRIKEVRYAYGNNIASPGATHHAKVYFDYDVRPDDKQLAYVAGHAFRTNRRLTTATVYGGIGAATEVRRYNLTYLPSSSDRISKLAQIEECNGNVCLEPTKFTWPAVTAESGVAQPATIALQQRDYPSVLDYQFGDINGDGASDVVWLSVDINQPSGDTDLQLHYAVSQGGSLSKGYFTNSQPKQNIDDSYLQGGDIPPMRVLDFNADGRMDVAVFSRQGAGSWRLFLSTYSPTANEWRLNNSPETVDIPDEDVVFADLNSDGLVDALSMAHDTATQETTLSVRHLIPGTASERSTSTYYKFSPPVTSVLTWSPAILANSPPVDMEVKPAGDLDGDGIVDIFLQMRYVGADAGSCPFVAHRTVGRLLKLNADRSVTELTSQEHEDCNSGTLRNGMQLLFGDINSDGLSDIVYMEPLSNGIRTTHAWLNDGASLATAGNIESLVVSGIGLPLGSDEDASLAQLVDFNYDGYLDMNWVDPSTQKFEMAYWDSETQSFGVAETLFTSSSANPERDRHQFIDVDGDGWTDRAHFTRDLLTIYISDNAGEAKQVITSIQNGLDAVTNVAYSTLSDPDVYERLTVSTSLSGNSVFCLTNGDCGNYPFLQADVTGFYSQLNAAWPGLHSLGNTADIQLAADAGKSSPVLELSGPMQVVQRVSSSSPGVSLAGGQYSASAMSHVNYNYGEAKLQASGRGFLGFERLRTLDEQTGVQTVTTYRQDFPFIGRPVKTTVLTSTGRRLRESTSKWQLKNYANGMPANVTVNGSAALGALQPILQESHEVEFDFNEAQAVNDEVALSSLTTTHQYDDAGNVINIVAVTKDGSGAEMHSQTTSNVYAGLSDADESARLGRLSQTTVTTARPGGVADNVREVHFTYFDETGTAAHGLLKEEIIEPNNAALKLVTTYTYDARGNRKSAAVTGAVGKDGTGAGHTRLTEFGYDATAHRYLSWTQRHYRSSAPGCASPCYPLGETAPTKAFRHSVVAETDRDAAGRPLRTVAVMPAAGATAPATMTTEVAYGALGRPYLEYRSDGSWTHTVFAEDAGLSGCDAAKTRYKVTQSVAGGGQTEICYDKLGREVRRRTLGFRANEFYVVDTEYDVLGRVKRVSEPYSSGSPVWTVNTYDILGRLIQVDHPVAGEKSFISYSADTSVTGAVLKVTTKNHLDHESVEFKNALGEVVRVQDEENSWVTYAYDAVGNLVGTNAMGVGSLISYDTLGRKTGMYSEDTGLWNYSYNAFGELVEQTDAEQGVTVISYDNHGRRIQRVETKAGVEQNNTLWIYDEQQFLGGLDVPGQLTDTRHTIKSTPMGEAAGSHFTALAYDALGRLSGRETLIDGVNPFEQNYTYDKHGRPFQKFDASDYFGGVRFDYNDRGYLKKISESGKRVDGDAPVEYYVINGMDSRGNVTSATLGNGAELTRRYQAESGLIEKMEALSVDGLVQDLFYDYDTVRNVSLRRDRGVSKLTGVAKDVNETFTYDRLNRLRTATIAGQATYTTSYDARGNITARPGIATMQYSSANNRLQSVTTSGSPVPYQHDGNGNLISGGGLEARYTVFNKPHHLSRGTGLVRFAYDGERRRYKRVVDGDTTWYVGNVEVQENTDGSMSYTRYVEGLAIVKFTRDPETGMRSDESTQYQITDNLGSLDAILDEDGYLLHDLSFDAWGQRRSPDSAYDVINNSTSVISNLISLTPRGFTGHEMLDSVGLVHMNGRVYDPRLGRFLSADPFVQAPTNTQSFNRYAYVWNNPLGYTDPSGYFVDQVFSMVAGTVGFLACGPVCSGAFAAAASYAQGASLQDAIISGISTYAFSNIAGPSFEGSAFSEAIGSVAVARGLAFGAVGGISSALQGGTFGHGFATAGLTGPFASGISSIVSPFVGPAGGYLVGRMVAGGTASHLTGGKFSNGAATGAFQVIVMGLARAEQEGRLVISSIREEGIGSWFDATFSPESQWKPVISMKDVTPAHILMAPVNESGALVVEPTRFVVFPGFKAHLVHTGTLFAGGYYRETDPAGNQAARVLGTSLAVVGGAACVTNIACLQASSQVLTGTSYLEFLSDPSVENAIGLGLSLYAGGLAHNAGGGPVPTVISNVTSFFAGLGL
ncbi:MAG: Ig-like domain-containing protein [Pseudomonadota bacterium]